jgi:hypothetical protein
MKWTLRAEWAQVAPSSLSRTGDTSYCGKQPKNGPRHVLRPHLVGPDATIQQTPLSLIRVCTNSGGGRFLASEGRGICRAMYPL